jgi:hypothetical protein
VIALILRGLCQVELSEQIHTLAGDVLVYKLELQSFMDLQDVDFLSSQRSCELVLLIFDKYSNLIDHIKEVTLGRIQIVLELAMRLLIA